jgi:hypothetical protein
VVNRSNKSPSPSIIISVGVGATTRRAVACVRIAFILLLGFSRFAFAQSEHPRLVVGSVYRIVRNLVEVKQDGGDIAVIKVDAATAYVNSSTQAAAKLKDLAVGDQIVIRVIVKAGVDTAEQVKFVPAVSKKQ